MISASSTRFEESFSTGAVSEGSNMATDSEFLYRAAFTPGVMEGFKNDPDNMSNILHFTERDEVVLYDEIDPTKRPKLKQDGKVVVITGAGRGVGKVST